MLSPACRICRRRSFLLLVTGLTAISVLLLMINKQMMAPIETSVVSERLSELPLQHGQFSKLPQRKVEYPDDTEARNFDKRDKERDGNDKERDDGTKQKLVQDNVSRLRINLNHDKLSPPQRTSSVQKVIILTYMRSGSTMTGDFFQQHPDVFYVYEPLWKVQQLYDKSEPFEYLNRPNHCDNNTFWSTLSLSVESMKNVMKCRFQDLDIGSLMVRHLVMSKCTKPYFVCVIRQHDPDVRRAISVCLPNLIPPCLKSRVVVAKTIRFTMEQVEEVMKSDPNVKVIHLFRDPRGAIQSQHSVGEFKWQNLEPKAASFCNRLLLDLRKSEKMSKIYPGRILTVRYEDIVQFPLAASEIMYDSVGLDMTEKIATYIWNITYAGHGSKCPLCTTRSNSTTTAYKWRRKLSFHYAQLIDRHCSLVYRVLGYRPFEGLVHYMSLNSPTIFEDFGEGYNVLSHTQLKSLNKRRQDQRK